MRAARIFSNTLGLQLPAIIQAPMAGGVTTPELVAAVSNSSGLGSFATGYLDAANTDKGISRIKKLTKNPFAVNVFIPNKCEKEDTATTHKYQESLNIFKRRLGMQEEFEIPLEPKDYFDEIIDVIIQHNVKVVSFTFGNLMEDTISRLKRHGIYLIGTATSLEEAKILAHSGIDAIVAQGYEAGGHRGSFKTACKQSAVGTMALVPRLVSALDVPIIAAGGIMTGSGVLAALSLGASAVQMGTAFLCTKESGAGATYQSQITGLKDLDVDLTTPTKAYSGKMARAINTAFIEHFETTEVPIPAYPLTNTLCGSLRKEAAKKNETAVMSMWAGQGAPLISSSLSAEELLRNIRQELSLSLADLHRLNICNP